VKLFRPATFPQRESRQQLSKVCQSFRPRGASLDAYAQTPPAGHHGRGQRHRGGKKALRM